MAISDLLNRGIGPSDFETAGIGMCCRRKQRMLQPMHAGRRQGRGKEPAPHALQLTSGKSENTRRPTLQEYVFFRVAMDSCKQSRVSVRGPHSPLRRLSTQWSNILNARRVQQLHQQPLRSTTGGTHVNPNCESIHLL